MDSTVFLKSDTPQNVLRDSRSPSDERYDAQVELHNEYKPDSAMMKSAQDLVDIARSMRPDPVDTKQRNSVFQNCVDERLLYRKAGNLDLR